MRTFFDKIVPSFSKQWLLYTFFITALVGVLSWVWGWASNKRNLPQGVRFAHLSASRDVHEAFPPGSWQHQAFEAFRARMLLQDPQVFPCIYATKGFKANEHRCCFIDDQAVIPGSPDPNSTLSSLAACFGEYAQDWRRCGPMTSLVVLTPLPTGDDRQEASLEDDRRRFWNLLRAISDRDPHAWPAHVPQDVSAPAWTLTFRGERFVGLALTPRYRKRQSRYCDGFVMVFQPIELFQELLSTPEKMASAFGKVRRLTDTLDDVPYSADVVAVGEGRQPVSSMFFLSDGAESWGSLHGKIRT